MSIWFLVVLLVALLLVRCLAEPPPRVARAIEIVCILIVVLIGFFLLAGGLPGLRLGADLD